jgi:hypothetical protein
MHYEIRKVPSKFRYKYPVILSIRSEISFKWFLSPIENRCLGKGEWNTYDVVCVDGTIKLSVNGKFVNGISKSSKKSGYICLESEGAEIHFRNLRIVELP